MPRRVTIDNPKCSITRACIKDPEVQRAYGELAEGYGFRIDPCPPRDPQKKGRVESGLAALGDSRIEVELTTKEMALAMRAES